MCPLKQAKLCCCNKKATNLNGLTIKIKWSIFVYCGWAGGFAVRLSECLLCEPGEWKGYYLKIANRLGEQLTLSLFTGLEKESEL